MTKRAIADTALALIDRLSSDGAVRHILDMVMALIALSDVLTPEERQEAGAASCPSHHLTEAVTTNRFSVVGAEDKTIPTGSELRDMGGHRVDDELWHGDDAMRALSLRPSEVWWCARYQDELTIDSDGPSEEVNSVRRETECFALAQT